MPRIHDENRNPFDYCTNCYIIVRNELNFVQREEYNLDADHPNYGETGYKCDRCGVLLEAKDD
jgi:hypothetical protein